MCTLIFTILIVLTFFYSYLRFFTLFENTDKKSQCYRSKTIRTIIWIIVECDMGFSCKNVSKIRNVTFICQNVEKKIQ